MHIDILHDVAVTPNLERGERITCGSPSACALRDGGVVVVYRRGSTKHSQDAILAFQRSDDGGKTWNAPVVIHDGLPRNPPESVLAGLAAETANGTLLALFNANDVPTPGTFIFSEEGRQQRQKVYVAASAAGGRTWSAAREHRFNGLPHLVYVAHRPLLLPDGDLLVPMEATGDRNHQFTFVSRYAPRREAFGPVTICAEDPTGQLSYGDARLTLLPDGRVLMLLWAFVTPTDETIDVHRCLSEDGGQTWTAPQSAGIRCQITVPLALGPGRLIAASNVRTAPDGIRLWASRDDGGSWDDPIQLWDLRALRVLGEPLSVSVTPGDKVWQALPGFTFGTPDLQRLADGSVLLTYYATVNDIIHVRACRFRVVW